jgi:hypothetical protein
MTTWRRSGPVRRATAGLALVTALALAGCSSDDPGGAPAPEPSTGSPGSSAPTESTSTSASVEPASGLEMTIRTVTMYGPEGWTRTSDLFDKLGKSVRDPKGSGLVGLYSVPAFSPDATIDDLVDAVRRTNNYVGRLQVHDPVDVNGEECFHVSGRYQNGGVEDQFGVNYGDYQVTFTFLFDGDVPDADRQAVIEPVLAGVQWN